MNYEGGVILSASVCITSQTRYLIFWPTPHWLECPCPPLLFFFKHIVPFLAHCCMLIVHHFPSGGIPPLSVLFIYGRLRFFRSSIKGTICCGLRTKIISRNVHFGMLSALINLYLPCSHFLNFVFCRLNLLPFHYEISGCCRRFSIDC